VDAEREVAQKMLPRLLSAWHVASRRQAEELVAAGRVTVDGRVVRDVTAWVSERARIAVDGTLVGPSAGGPVWIALNKPRGVVTTTNDPEGRRTVMDLLSDPPPGLAPVGRLDMDSAGLLLLTNDHAKAAVLLDPASHVAKTYRVKVEGHPASDTLARLGREAIVDRDETLGPIEVRLVSEGPKSAWLEVVLREGKNRQIRRQLAAVGHEVQVLVRTAFGPIALGDLAPGASRRLTAAEIASLG
jgi:23S rRNA pseudouridine2605 synthase